MKVLSGTFVGNGTFQQIEIGWKPEIVFIRSSNAANYMVFTDPGTWCRRTNRLHAQAAVQSGIQITPTGFVVGGLSDANGSGDTLYWFAIGRSAEDPWGAYSVAYMGSGAAGRLLRLPRQEIPLVTIFKRDSNAVGIFWERTFGWGTRMDSTSQASQTAYVIAAEPGLLTLTGDIRVNEYNTGNGEGITAVCISPNASNIRMYQWWGNGQANRRIPTGVNRNIRAVLAQVADGTGGMRLKTPEMASGEAGVVGAAGLQAGNIQLDGGDFILPNSSGLNISVRLYTALVFFDETETPLPEQAPAIITSGKQAIVLPGSTVNSYINCGASDATLKISGSITLEITCQAQYGAGADSTVGTDATLLARSIGVTGPAASPDTRGNFSFAMALVRNQGTASQGWSGPQLMTTVSSFLDLQLSPVQCGYLWRTGLLPFNGLPFEMWHLVISGTGLAGAAQLCYIYRNGVLVKQRDMAVPSGVVGVTGGTGHTTCIGARWDGTNFVGSTKMKFRGAGVWARALTADEIRSRYESFGLGSTTADNLLSSAAEFWDASNARNGALAATVNSANNGTINQGIITKL